MSVTVEQVSTNRQLESFIRFPKRLYRDVEQYIPDLTMDEKNNLNPKSNPAFANTESRLFLARRDGEVAGRIGAIRALQTSGEWKPDTLRFTRIDFIDDDEVVDALFDAVKAWGRELGCVSLKGPLGFSDLDKEGMLVEGFEYPNTLVTIYNHPYYPRQLERVGFVKDVDWVEYFIKISDQPNERIERLANVVKTRQKLHLVNVKNARELKPNLHAMFALLNEAYKSLYGVTPISSAQIDHYVGQFLPLVNLEFVKFIYDASNVMAAFSLGLPSLSKALKSCNGRLFPDGLFKILRAKKKNDALDLLLVAVRPDLQNAGLNALLMHEMNLTAIKYGIRYVESSPELETNEKVRAFWKNYESELRRRRRCFVCAL